MMMIKQVCIILLLGAGVAGAWVSGLGFYLMRDAFARLHYVTLASLSLPVVVALAIILDASSVQTSVKAAAVAVIFTITAPAVTHATARALYVREMEGKPSRQDKDEKDEKGGAS